MKKNIVLYLVLTFFALNSALGADGLNGSGNTVAAATSVDLTITNTNLSVYNSARLTTSGSSGTPKSYLITVTSANGGLKNANAISKGASNANAIIPYSLNWSATSGTATATSVTIDSTTKKTIASVTDNSGTSTYRGNIVLSRTGTSQANLISGTYTDTITLASEQTSPSATTLSGNVTFTLTTRVVNDVITLTVTPTSSASNLPLSVTQTQLSIGTVSITANCQNGYTLKIASSNSGVLKNTVAGPTPAANEKINYSLFYQGSQVTASSTPVTVATVNSASLYTTSTQIGSVGMSYTGITPSLMRAGTYQDNLTFTLTSQ